MPELKFPTPNEMLINDALEALKINQTQLAKLLDVTKGQITNWKKGEVIPPARKEELIKLSKKDWAYSVPTEYLKIVKSAENEDLWIAMLQGVHVTLTQPVSSESGFTEIGPGALLSSLIHDEPNFALWYLLPKLEEIGIKVPPTPQNLSKQFTTLISEFCLKMAETEQQLNRYIRASDNPTVNGYAAEYLFKIDTELSMIKIPEQIFVDNGADEDECRIVFDIIYRDCTFAIRDLYKELVEANIESDVNFSELLPGNDIDFEEEAIYDAMTIPMKKIFKNQNYILETLEGIQKQINNLCNANNLH